MWRWSVFTMVKLTPQQFCQWRNSISNACTQEWGLYLDKLSLPPEGAIHFYPSCEGCMEIWQCHFHYRGDYASNLICLSSVNLFGTEIQQAQLVAGRISLVKDGSLWKQACEMTFVITLLFSFFLFSFPKFSRFLCLQMTLNEIFPPSYSGNVWES